MDQINNRLIILIICKIGNLIFSLIKSTYESFGIVAEHGQNKQDRLRQKYSKYFFLS